MRFVVYKQTQRVPEKEPVKRTLLWYDKLYGRMLTFDCTKLDFDYKEEKFVEIFEKSILRKIPEDEATQFQKDVFGIRSVWDMRPKPVTHDKTVITVKEINPVEKWFNKFMDYSNLDIIIIDRSDADTTFQVNGGKDADEFEDELYRNRFNYRRTD